MHHYFVFQQAKIIYFETDSTYNHLSVTPSFSVFPAGNLR